MNIKKVLAVLLILIALVVITFVTLPVMSRKAPELGLQDGKLTACPDKPNCLCSEYPGTNYIEPVDIIPGTTDIGMYITAIENMGGKVIAVRERYLRAAFTTPVMRFIDDFELRIDPDNAVLHIRSASRVGHSDLGKNRQRIEEFKLRLKAVTG